MSEPPHRPVRVLIADDDPRVRTALSTLVTSYDDLHVVGTCASVADALVMARRDPPTVALVDVHLPEARDGLTLLHVLTTDLRVPAIAMSIDGGLEPSALAAGATCFFDKANRTDELVAALRSVQIER